MLLIVHQLFSSPSQPSSTICITFSGQHKYMDDMLAKQSLQSSCLDPLPTERGIQVVDLPISYIHAHGFLIGVDHKAVRFRASDCNLQSVQETLQWSGRGAVLSPDGTNPTMSILTQLSLLALTWLPKCSQQLPIHWCECFTAKLLDGISISIYGPTK